MTAQELNVFGLTIAAVPDRRVYGGPGAYGSDTPSVVTPLEQHAVDGAVKTITHSAYFDIFATHEPVAANELRKDPPSQIRQANAGHLHAQNKENQIQQKGHPITLTSQKNKDDRECAVSRGIGVPAPVDTKN